MTAIKCCLVAIVAITCAAVVLSNDSYNPQENYQIEFYQIFHTHASRIVPLATTLEGLESRSENIVRGRILNDARMVFQFSQFDPTVVNIGHNFVSLEILEVVKGDLNVGEIITLAEPYYVEERVLITHANYLPSIPYQEYFFFLSAQRTNPDPEEFAGIFWVLQENRGRFHIPNSRADISRLRHNAENLVLATTYISNLPMMEARLTVNDIYMSLWQEVIETYMDWRHPPIPNYRFHVDNTSLYEATQQEFSGTHQY